MKSDIKTKINITFISFIYVLVTHTTKKTLQEVLNKIYLGFLIIKLYYKGLLDRSQTYSQNGYRRIIFQMF